MSELEQVREELAELRRLIVRAQKTTFNGKEAAAYFGIGHDSFAKVAPHIPRIVMPGLSAVRYSRKALDAAIEQWTEEVA